jgi:transposase
LLFEALTLMLAPTMSVLAAGRLLRVRSRRLWRVIDHHVRQARARESHAGVRAIGVDETASKRGQTYISVFYDLDAQRLLFATPGRDKATLEKFATDLTEHGGQPTAITHVSMDMSGSFQAGAAEHFPDAEVCFDRFHVVALSSTALDEVRRAEVKTAPELKGTRWGSAQETRRLDGQANRDHALVAALETQDGTRLADQAGVARHLHQRHDA